MFRGRRKGPWPPSREEDPFTRIRPIIATIVEVITGGILRAGKTAYGSGTGFWLGKDPADNECKFDIGTPTDYFRYDESNGVQIAADGSGLTNIAGANIAAASILLTKLASPVTDRMFNTGTLSDNIQAWIHANDATLIDGGNIYTRTIVAAALNVTNLQAVSAKTGALTVDNTLTMGEDGIITWMSGAAKITDDHMDVALTTSERYAFRFLDGDTVHAYLGAYKSANLTQLSIEAIGPADTKYGKIALAATESTGPEPETVDMIIRSDTGVIFSALNYAASRLFKVDTMDGHFAKHLGVIAAPTTAIALRVVNAAVNAASTYSGAQIHVTKTAGATDHGDVLHGAYLLANMDQNGGTIGHLYGTLVYARINDGNVGDASNSRHIYSHRTMGDLNAGKVYGNVYALHASIDQEVANEVTGNVYALYLTTSTLGTVGGSVYGIFQSGSAHNYLSGNLGIKTNAPTIALDINSDIVRLRTAKTPASAGAAGNTGDQCWDATYEYRCIASNTWTRVARATW